MLLNKRVDADKIEVDFLPDTQHIQRRRDRIFRVKNISCSRSYPLQVYAKYSRLYSTAENYPENVPCKYLCVIFSMQYFSNARKVISSTYTAILPGVLRMNVYVENKFHSAKIFPDWVARWFVKGFCPKPHIGKICDFIYCYDPICEISTKPILHKIHWVKPK